MFRAVKLPWLVVDSMRGYLLILAATAIIAAIMSEKRDLKYAFLSNLRVPMALGRKLKRVVDNNWTKMRRLRGCCGDYGQPGC